MSDDILSRIDEVMAANARRFDPFPDAWDGNRVERVDDGMRVRYAAEPAAEAEPDGNVPIPLNDDGSRFAMNSRPGLFRRPEPASPWLTLEDIGGRPDRIGDALRAEALRQGLSECEIDGQPWQYRDGQWASSRNEVRHEGPWTVIDETHVWLPAAPEPCTDDSVIPPPRPWWKRWLP